MCLNLPVSLMKLSVCRIADGLVRICFREKALRLIVKISLCLCILYLRHRNRKCLVVSVMFGQCGQYGVSALLIR